MEVRSTLAIGCASEPPRYQVIEETVELGHGRRARAKIAFARVLLQDPLWDTGLTVFELSGGVRNANIRTEMSV